MLCYYDRFQFSSHQLKTWHSIFKQSKKEFHLTYQQKVVKEYVTAIKEADGTEKQESSRIKATETERSAIDDQGTDELDDDFLDDALEAMLEQIDEGVGEFEDDFKDFENVDGNEESNDDVKVEPKKKKKKVIVEKHPTQSPLKTKAVQQKSQRKITLFNGKDSDQIQTNNPPKSKMNKKSVLQIEKHPTQSPLKVRTDDRPSKKGEDDQHSLKRRPTAVTQTESSKKRKT